MLPFIKKYCIDCHSGDKAKGGLTLEGYVSEAHARKDRKNWGAVQHVIAAGEMPPQEASRSRRRTRSEFIINWIENSLTKVDCSPRRPKDPGRVTIRRLNRAEYNNTIRDLCGVDFKPADDFPADDVGYGFDNIGDVLSFQPILLEKYLAAADKILDDGARHRPNRRRASKQTFRPQNIIVIPRAAKAPRPGSTDRVHVGRLGVPGEVQLPGRGRVRHPLPGVGHEGRRRVPEGDDPRGRQGREDVHRGRASRASRRRYEVTAKFTAGEKRVAVAFTNAFEDKDNKKVREFGLERSRSKGRSTRCRRPSPRR